MRRLATTGGNIIDLASSDDFQRDVVDASQRVPVLVDFTATWCPPCKMLKPRLEALATRHSSSMKLVKVDVDVCDQTAAAHRINAVPTVMLYRGGKAVDQFQGLQSDEQLETFVARHLKK